MISNDQKAEPALDDIADQLRLIRLTAHQQRYPGRTTPKLPSRTTIIQIQSDVVSLLYPRHFGPKGLDANAIETHVRCALELVRLRLT